MKLEVPEIQSVDHLIQILNSNDQILSDAHKTASQEFEQKLVSFWVFRETMLERTAEFLHNFVPSAPTIDGIRRRVEEAITVSLGLCLSRSNPYTIESDRLTEEDAYKSRYLLEYLSFLKDLNMLIGQYMEYTFGSAMNLLQALNSVPELPLPGGNTVLNPQVKGIPVNQPEADPADKNSNQKKKEADTKKAYKIAIVLLILEKGGWEKFTENLTNEGMDMLYAEVTGSSQRYFAGNKNDDNPKDFPWRKYAPDAEIFLENLPRYKG